MNIFYCFIGCSGQDDKTIGSLDIVVDPGQIDGFAWQLEEILVFPGVPLVSCVECALQFAEAKKIVTVLY